MLLADKLNLGCGNDIRPGYVNLDRVQLPGVDITWELTNYPYPFDEGRFSEIELVNVLEHLPDTVKVLEELHRISKPGGKITIRVPYWNGLEQSTDPTHVRMFNEFSFDYFDPQKPLGIRRPYYSKAKFYVKSVNVWIKIWTKYILIRDSVFSKALLFLSHYISNIVRLLDVDLIVIKTTSTSQQQG